MTTHEIEEKETLARELEDLNGRLREIIRLLTTEPVEVEEGA